MANQPGVSEHVKWSSILWGLHWSEILPVSLIEDEFIATSCEHDEAMRFIQKNFSTIYETDDHPSPFSDFTMSPARSKYYSVAGDFFAFRSRAEMVGIFVGAPTDWATYYVRNAAVLKEYQSKGLTQKFLSHLFAALTAVGVERVEADTAPSNIPSMKAMIGAGFNVTGTLLSERWGSLIRMTRFLSHSHEDIFLSQFCSGIHYQKKQREAQRDRKTPTKEGT